MMGLAAIWFCWVISSRDVAGVDLIPVPTPVTPLPCRSLPASPWPAAATPGIEEGGVGTGLDRECDDAADLEDDSSNDEPGLFLAPWLDVAPPLRLTLPAEPTGYGFQPSTRSPQLRC
jgi:hypothetical protein